MPKLVIKASGLLSFLRNLNDLIHFLVLSIHSARSLVHRFYLASLLLHVVIDASH